MNRSVLLLAPMISLAVSAAACSSSGSGSPAPKKPARVASSSSPASPPSSSAAAPSSSAPASRTLTAQADCRQADTILGTLTRQQDPTTYLPTAMAKFSNLYSNISAGGGPPGSVAVAGTKLTFDLGLLNMDAGAGGDVSSAQASFTADLPKLINACSKVGYAMQQVTTGPS